MRALAFLVDQLFWVYEWLIIIRILLSFFRPAPYHPAVRLLHKLTDPVLEPARRLIPPVGAFDFSPIIVFLALSWARRVIINLLYMLG